MSKLHRKLAAVLFVFALALVTACGDSGSGSAGGSTTSAHRDSSGAASDARPAADSTTTSTTTTAAASSLEGQWTANIQDLLTGTSSPASQGGLTCSGAQTVTFRNDRVTIGGDGNCQMGPMTGSVRYYSHGDYRTDHDQLIVSNFQDETTFQMGGVPFNGGVGGLGNGTVTYSISGNVLTITSNTPEVGTVHQTYTRVNSAA